MDFNNGVWFSLYVYYGFLMEKFLATALSPFRRKWIFVICMVYSRLYIIEKVYHFEIYQNFFLDYFFYLHNCFSNFVLRFVRLMNKITYKSKEDCFLLAFLYNVRVECLGQIFSLKVFLRSSFPLDINRCPTMKSFWGQGKFR